MAPKNSTTKVAKKTLKKQSRPTYKHRDEATINESIGSVEQFVEAYLQARKLCSEWKIQANHFLIPLPSLMKDRS